MFLFFFHFFFNFYFNFYFVAVLWVTWWVGLVHLLFGCCSVSWILIVVLDDDLWVFFGVE